MKAILFIFTIFFSCGQSPEKDFNDKVVDFVIENRTNTYIELPDLYPDPVERIPSDAEDHSRLIEKLTARGFRITRREQGSAPLDGKHFVRFSLSGEKCDCDVVKTYATTAYLSQYKLTERIRCR